MLPHNAVPTPGSHQAMAQRMIRETLVACAEGFRVPPDRLAVALVNETAYYLRKCGPREQAVALLKAALDEAYKAPAP